jgi:hypothetical protein
VPEVLHDGPAPLWDAIVRKVTPNVFVLVHWTVALLIVLAIPWLLRTRLSPTMRAAVADNLLLAAVGFALNDSGPVVVALALFYLGPLLAVLRAEERPATFTTPVRAPAAGPRRPWQASGGPVNAPANRTPSRHHHHASAKLGERCSRNSEHPRGDPSGRLPRMEAVA